MENAANLAFDLFDRQGWPLGDLSAEEIARKIVQRYLEMDAAFRPEEGATA
jgi:hypothetical protein